MLELGDGYGAEILADHDLWQLRLAIVVRVHAF
jgi:hypothetical protein